MNNINLGVAITISKELRAIRSITNRIEKYKKYRDFHKLNNNIKVENLINNLKELKKILTGEKKEGVYNKTRLKVINLPTLEEQWETKTETPWIATSTKTDKLLNSRLKQLKTAKIKARITEQRWRLTQQLINKANNSHYIIFNTLTINPQHYGEIWSEKSKSFGKYIKYFKNIAGDGHTYFAVRESGESNGRLHIHVIHTLKEIPNSWKKDPNDGQEKPWNREIWQAKKAWKYGFSSPIAIRFNTMDAWSKLGWRWPVKNIEGKTVPIPITNPTQMAGYLSKYLTKTLNEGPKNKWKTKISKNLGLEGIQNAITTLTTEELEMMATLTTGTLITIQDKPIPKGILIKEATRELLKRQKRLSWKKQLKNLLEITPQPSIIEQWKNSIQKSRKSNSQNTQSIRTKTMNSTECYKTKAIKIKLLKAVKCIYDPTNFPYAKHIIPSHRNPLNI